MRGSVDGKKTSVVGPIFWFNIRPNLVGYLSAWHRIGMIVTLKCEEVQHIFLQTHPADPLLTGGFNIIPTSNMGIGPAWATKLSATSIGSSKGQQWWHRGRSGRMSKASGTSTAVVATSWALANSSGRSSKKMVISLGLLNKNGSNLWFGGDHLNVRVWKDILTLVQ